MTNNVNLPEKWEADYIRGSDGWDQGRPTPVLQLLASSGRFQPGRMLVPGAGRGHDAREFARHGFQVTAVDFTSYAINEMQRLTDPHAPVEIMQHDIFTLSDQLDNSYDYILEYTCFCAIDPPRRSEYAELVQRLLKPGGTFIDLAFPLDGRAGGPPFAVSENDLLKLFQNHGLQLVSQETPENSVPQRKGAEKLFIFSKLD